MPSPGAGQDDRGFGGSNDQRGGPPGTEGGNRDGGEFKRGRKRVPGVDGDFGKARTKLRQFDPFSMTFSSGGGQFGSGRKSLLSRRDGFKFT
jgi:hypothetical protein